MILAVVCYDNTALWDELKDRESRIVKLETLCNQMNTNISSLQSIAAALQEKDYVTNVAPIKENGKEIGYTITFSKSGSITIYHSADGQDGADGITPQLKIEESYWYISYDNGHIWERLGKAVGTFA